jgi:hypothetical protein
MTFEPDQASAEAITAAVDSIGFSARVERSRGDRHV